MSEHLTPEEDTIGRQHDTDDDREENGPPAESGEKPAPDREETPAS